MPSFTEDAVNDVIREVRKRAERSIAAAAIQPLEDLRVSSTKDSGDSIDHITFSTWDFGGQVQYMYSE